MSFKNAIDFTRSDIGIREKFNVVLPFLTKILLVFSSIFPLILFSIKQFNITIDKDMSSSIILAVISLSLLEIINNTTDKRKMKFYSSQQDMYNDLLNICRKNIFKEAVFIQYSGRKAFELILELQRKGTNISILVKNPDNAINDEQKKRIWAVVEELKKEIGDSNNKVCVLGYKNRASLRGVVLDRKIIALGWYIFENKESSNDTGGFEIDIWGHNKPGVLLYAKNEGFVGAVDFFSRVKEHCNKFSIKLY